MGSSELLSSFAQSVPYAWKVERGDVQAAIQAAVEATDVGLLLYFVSHPPRDGSGTYEGPGMLYVDLCTDVVFPFLAEHADIATAQTVCDTMLEHDPGYEGYSNAAFEVLRKAGLAAAEAVCGVVVSSYASINLWKRAVGFLGALGDTEAVPSIIRGMKTVHPKWSSLNKESAMEVGVWALVKLDAHGRVDVFYDLMSQDDRDVMQATIRALGRYGDEQAVEALKRRLSGPFEPVTAKHYRDEIAEAIQKIDGRAP